jgi:hypothetical protein
MTDLTIQRQSQSSASQERSALTVELAKMLGLVAPVTMSADQQTLWLASAVETLGNISAAELREVSVQVRQTAKWPSEIVPEVSRLVRELRERESRRRQIEAETREALTMLPAKKHIMDRDRSTFTQCDWDELNAYLEKQGSPVRYTPRGAKIAA